MLQRCQANFTAQNTLLNSGALSDVPVSDGDPVAVTRDGLPIARAATGANVNDTVLFERLFRMALAVMGHIGTAYADREYAAESSLALCRGHGVRPRIGRRRTRHGSGLGKRRWPVERTNA